VGNPRLSIQTEWRMDMSIFTNAGHVSRDALSLQVLNDLPGRWVEPVGEHLSSCNRCQLELMEIGELIAALRMLAKPSLPSNRRATMAN
jgi:hypothetical protein